MCSLVQVPSTLKEEMLLGGRGFQIKENEDGKN